MNYAKILDMHLCTHIFCIYVIIVIIIELNQPLIVHPRQQFYRVLDNTGKKPLQEKNK